MFFVIFEIDIMVMGGGDGGVITQLVKHKNVRSIEHVEIDAKIPQLAKKYFPHLCVGFRDPRHNLIINDAKAYLR